MSLAFGKTLGRRSAFAGVRDQYPQPRSGHQYPVVSLQARPLAPTPRPVFNGPMGQHGPSGMVSLQPQSLQPQSVRGGATGILIRNRRPNGFPQRVAYAGLGATSDAEWAEMGLGAGGGSAGSGSSRRGISDGTVNKFLDIFSGFLNSRKPVVPDAQVYAPVQPVPQPSSMPSWAVPALAVGALGIVGAVIYSVAR